MYIDLERLIELCRFSPRETQVIDDLMYGYTSADIADRIGVARQTVDVIFKRAVRKIVEANGKHWYEVYDNRASSV